jgi:GT2 family glycosyltransferase
MVVPRSASADLRDRVTVVVLTHGRRDEVLATLARMRTCGASIIVADNASRDGTGAAIASRFPEVDVVRHERNLGAAGRNGAVAAARTPYVAFCDDDTWWAPGALAHAAAVLDRHPRLAAVTARVLWSRAGAKTRPTSARRPVRSRTTKACPAPSSSGSWRGLA